MRRTIPPLLILACLAAATLASAKDIPLKASSLVPAAEGKVSFEHDRNKNTRFTVHVKHLARPDSLTPAKTVYVVWVEPQGKDPENVGVLRVNENLEGSLAATTPYQLLDVFVTAEDSPNADHPAGPEIMRGTLQLK